MRRYADKLSLFKKHEINGLNRIEGGHIKHSTTSSATGMKYTDYWYLFKSNNDTNPNSHTDNFVDW